MTPDPTNLYGFTADFIRTLDTEIVFFSGLKVARVHSDFRGLLNQHNITEDNARHSSTNRVNLYGHRKEVRAFLAHPNWMEAHWILKGDHVYRTGQNACEALEVIAFQYKPQDGSSQRMLQLACDQYGIKDKHCDGHIILFGSRWRFFNLYTDKLFETRCLARFKDKRLWTGAAMIDRMLNRLPKRRPVLNAETIPHYEPENCCLADDWPCEICEETCY